MNELLKILKLLSDRNRLRILMLLKKRKMCVCELASILGITQPSVSRHLKKLIAAGFASSEQDGYWTNYFMKKADNLPTKVLLEYLSARLNNNCVIKTDARKANRVNRSRVCCKRRSDD